MLGLSAVESCFQSPIVVRYDGQSYFVCLFVSCGRIRSEMRR